MLQRRCISYVTLGQYGTLHVLDGRYSYQLVYTTVRNRLITVYYMHTRLRVLECVFVAVTWPSWMRSTFMHNYVSRSPVARVAVSTLLVTPLCYSWQHVPTNYLADWRAWTFDCPNFLRYLPSVCARGTPLCTHPQRNTREKEKKKRVCKRLSHLRTSSNGWTYSHHSAERTRLSVTLDIWKKGWRVCFGCRCTQHLPLLP